MSVVNWSIIRLAGGRGSDVSKAEVLGARMKELRDSLTLYLT